MKYAGFTAVVLLALAAPAHAKDKAVAWGDAVDAANECSGDVLDQYFDSDIAEPLALNQEMTSTFAQKANGDPLTPEQTATYIELQDALSPCRRKFADQTRAIDPLLGTTVAEHARLQEEIALNLVSKQITPGQYIQQREKLHAAYSEALRMTFAQMQEPERTKKSDGSFLGVVGDLLVKSIID